MANLLRCRQLCPTSLLRCGQIFLKNSGGEVFEALFHSPENDAWVQFSDLEVLLAIDGEVLLAPADEHVVHERGHEVLRDPIFYKQINDVDSLS